MHIFCIFSAFFLFFAYFSHIVHIAHIEKTGYQFSAFLCSCTVLGGNLLANMHNMHNMLNIKFLLFMQDIADSCISQNDGIQSSMHAWGQFASIGCHRVNAAMGHCVCLWAALIPAQFSALILVSQISCMSCCKLGLTNESIHHGHWTEVIKFKCWSLSVSPW